MIGGSAPSQTSGAPYRTESSNRSPVWPSATHQSDICNQGYGVYSLFPEPGDTPRTFFNPTSKISHHNSFPDFTGTQKVSDTFFSSKFTFVSNKTPQFDSSSHPKIEQEVSQLSFTQISKSYSPPLRKSEERDAQKEIKPITISNDIINIKTEMEEMNKEPKQNKSAVKRQTDAEEEAGSRNKKNGGILTEKKSSERGGEILANEPDSTEFKVSNKDEIYEYITTSEVESLSKELFTSGNKIDRICGSNPAKCPESNEIIEKDVNKDKCNIKTVDWINETCGKKQKKVTEKPSVKVESISDFYSKLTEKKCVNVKTPDSNSKNLLIPNKKFFNESSKPSPTRTLSLSPQNGGCSRTTPLIFKHTSQQDADSKSQNIHIEDPPLFIKKEPFDFHKNSNGTAFHSPPHLDTSFFSPGGLNVLNSQLLSPMPFSNNFESSSRQKDSFLGPIDQNFFNPNHTFLSPRPAAESSFLSPNLDLARFDSYKNYSTLPKIGGSYLMSSSEEKISERMLLRSPGYLPSKEDRRSEDSGIFVNFSTIENESKKKVSENSTCGGSNLTPCQVAEVTSASSLLSPKHSSANPLVVKQETICSGAASASLATTTSVEQNKETTFMISGQSTIVSSTVGTASARRRCQQRLNEIEISSPQVVHRSVQSPASIDLPPAMGASVFSGGMMGERSTNLITTWPAQTHNPTLWQYSAPIDYPPFPPVGFQLVRDPITGHFLLIPASNLEALQRAILWPSYQASPPHMIIPPLSVQPSTPHLLLDTNVPAVDFLTSETIHHSAPQHRIMIASNDSSKKKIPAPTMIKLESLDCPSNAAVTVSGSNNVYSKTLSETLSPKKEPVFHSQRTSISIETGRRSQGTSPCLNPVLESLSNQIVSREAIAHSSKPQKTITVTLQDASNQTDMPFETGSGECLSSLMCKDKFLPYTKTTEKNIKVAKTQDVGTDTALFAEFQCIKQSVFNETQQKKEVGKTLNTLCVNVPDPLSIKKEIVSPTQVDISGLELLSNSIEQFVSVAKIKKTEVENKSGVTNGEGNDERKDLSIDACEGAVLLQNLKNGFKETEETKIYQNETSKNFGGLGLLCALAEQRFKEEIGKALIDNKSINMEEEQKKESSKEKKIEDILINNSQIHLDEDAKEYISDNNYHSDSDGLPKLKREDEILGFGDNNSTAENMNEPVYCKGECKHNEVDFLNSTISSCEKIFKRGPGRPKKFKRDHLLLKPFLFLRSQQNSKEMSPPILEKETDFPCNATADLKESELTNSKEDILKPPTLTPSTILDPVIKTMAGTLELTPCEVNLIALKFSSDKLNKKKNGAISDNETKKRKLSDINNSFSSSKKRKVGRPKKHHLLHENSLTETIVAKKPKAKPYLIQSAQTIENSHCLKAKNEDMASELNDTKKNSFPKPDSSLMDPVDAALEGNKKSKKIRPKLKAEPKIKDWTLLQDDENHFPSEKKKLMKKEDNYKQKIKIQKKVAVDGRKSNESSRINGTKEPALPGCVLTTEHLKSDKFPMRTLTAMGGLFYAGQLSAIRPPDVYGVTIDGERGNRPHIYSREEILKDSILEVKPENTKCLIPGTRCCAYWSEQYRCLYPGMVSAPASPDPELDDKFVNVEFDDGDSGRIDIDDIRLLPQDYPIVEYDPNPLQSLCKRKRRVSGASIESHSKERKSIDSMPTPEKNENPNDKIFDKFESVNEKTERKKLIKEYEPGSFISLESERRHLKKKRREKLKRLQSLSLEGKKKHKKHRCSDEHRHHRHHKKHRKHKHKHGKRHSNEINGEIKRGDEKIEEIPNKDKEEASIKKKYESKGKPAEKNKEAKPKKCKERTESVESRSKMAAFLPARQLWGWSGKGFRRPGAKGRARKEFYKTIQRGKERITVGDCAVFLSTGRPDRPYIGRIESMWESWGTNMIVRVKWFYHPEETVGCPATLEYPGALFESPHIDENDVQTISHKCEVLPLGEYTAKIGNDPQRYETIYDNNDIYYLAGYYDPTNTTLKMEPGVK